MNREVWTGHTTPMANRGARAGGSTGTRCSRRRSTTEEDFPLSAADYVEQYGDHPIRIDYETVVSRRGDLRGVEKEEFGDFVEFHQELGRARARERLLVLRGC